MNTVLFDLDGTLLPLNQDDFLDTYYKLLQSRMQNAGYDAKSVMNGLNAGVRAIYENEGMLTNEEVFFDTFSKYVPEDQLKGVTKEFNRFYAKDFDVLKLNTTPTPYAAKTVSMLKKKGYQLVVATNPLFPALPIHKRIEWAGLSLEDFSFVTTYENSSFCKPNLNYYKKILWTIRKKAEDCLMVGNHAVEDLCVAKLGMDIFMLKPCLINPTGVDLSDYKLGDWEAFYEYASSFPDLNI